MTSFTTSLAYILKGLDITLKVYFVTIVFSITFGRIIASVRSAGSKFVKRSIDTYTWLLRGTPLLLQLYFVMYGLPSFGIKMDREMVAYFTFTLNYTAYFTEIIRGGIESVNKGQHEAAKTLGFSRIQTFRVIILPQGLKRVLPALTNEAVTLVKDTSLVAAIALGDILRNSKEIAARTFSAEPFIIAALIYLLLTFVVVKVFKYLELKYSYYK